MRENADGFAPCSPESIWLLTGPPQKGLPGPFPGAPERIRIKFVGLLYQITHDLIMINRELDPKAQAPKD